MYEFTVPSSTGRKPNVHAKKSKDHKIADSSNGKIC